MMYNAFFHEARYGVTATEPKLPECVCWVQLAPETFRRLAMGEAAMRKAMGGNLGALQCTHPRSETRVQMLEEELGMMKEQPELALQKVMHKVPYWML